MKGPWPCLLALVVACFHLCRAQEGAASPGGANDQLSTGTFAPQGSKTALPPIAPPTEALAPVSLFKFLVKALSLLDVGL